MSVIKRYIVKEQKGNFSTIRALSPTPLMANLWFVRLRLRTLKPENKEIFHFCNGLKWASKLFTFTVSCRTNLSLEERALGIHQTRSNFRHLFHETFTKSALILLLHVSESYRISQTMQLLHLLISCVCKIRTMVVTNCSTWRNCFISK